MKIKNRNRRIIITFSKRLQNLNCNSQKKNLFKAKFWQTQLNITLHSAQNFLFHAITSRQFWKTPSFHHPPKHLTSPNQNLLFGGTNHFPLPRHHTHTHCLVVVHKFQHLSLSETFPLPHSNQLANNYLASRAPTRTRKREPPSPFRSSVECLA